MNQQLRVVTGGQQCLEQRSLAIGVLLLLLLLFRPRASSPVDMAGWLDAAPPGLEPRSPSPSLVASDDLVSVEVPGLAHAFEEIGALEVLTSNLKRDLGEARQEWQRQIADIKEVLTELTATLAAHRQQIDNLAGAMQRLQEPHPDPLA